MTQITITAAVQALLIELVTYKYIRIEDGAPVNLALLDLITAGWIERIEVSRPVVLTATPVPVREAACFVLTADGEVACEANGIRAPQPTAGPDSAFSLEHLMSA